MTETPRARVLTEQRVLLALGLIALVLSWPIMAGRRFPEAWTNVGGILACLAVAFPALPPVNRLARRGRTGIAVLGSVVLHGAAVYCFMLGWLH